jgi:hypothetical protein
VGVVRAEQWHARSGCNRRNVLLKAPLARLQHAQGGRVQDLQLLGQALGQSGHGGATEFDVVHRHAKRAQLVAKVAHGREEQRDACRVAPHLCGFAGRFEHQHRVLRGIEAAERRAVVAELVAEHQHEVPQ